MPSFYAHKNDAYSNVATAPSPATSGVSLVVTAGQGTLLSTGYAWVWPSGVQPLTTNSEIVLITNITTDTLTITRAQQGSTARSIAIGWQIAQGLTKSDIEQIENAINYAADAGVNDTYTITLAPVPAAYTTGQVVLFKANTANTGAATLNVNGLGAKTIKKANGADLADNDILASQIAAVIYDGTNFQLLNLGAAATNTDAWTSWVPTVYKADGTTVATATIQYAKYLKVGKKTFFKFGFSSVQNPAGTSVFFTPPTTPLQTAFNMFCGSATASGTGITNSVVGFLLVANNSTTANLFYQSNLTPTLPTAGDLAISGSGFYENT